MKSIPADSSISAFVGVYSIDHMPDFDEAYMHAEAPAFFRITANGQGEFGFGYVHGYIDGKVTQQKGEIRFRWEGNDEMDEASGDGWLAIKAPGEAEGEIGFFNGDDHAFSARKVE